MSRKRGKRGGVSKNLLAILLIVAILLSVIGTYMAIYNANAVRVVDISPPSFGQVGVVVTNNEDVEVDRSGG